MPRTLALIVLLCGVAFAHAQPVTPSGGETQAFANFTRDWRDDPAWKDTAEVAVYDVTRVIDEKTREYRATVLTHKELADPVTKTRSATNEGREVFKQIIREDIPTDSGVEHLSTMVYVGVSDLKSLRIDVAWLDNVGSTFKWYANHKGTLEWHQFSYHPNEGHKTGTYSPPENFVFQDALGVVLRGYPLEKTENRGLRVLLNQSSNRLTREKPRPMTLLYTGRQKIELPMGEVEAFGLRLANPLLGGEKVSTVESVTDRYSVWFATDSKPPWLNIMVACSGPDGVSYKLHSLDRKPLNEVAP